MIKGEVGSPLICQFDSNFKPLKNSVNKKSVDEDDNILVLMGLATNVLYRGRITNNPYHKKQSSGFISIQRHFDWINKITWEELDRLDDLENRDNTERTRLKRLSVNDREF